MESGKTDNLFVRWMKAVPFLLVLITEVKEAWGVKQELHQVVRYQQHQAQSVEAEKMGRRKISWCNDSTALPSKLQKRNETQLGYVSCLILYFIF